jgi:hypothetical protein
MWITLRVTHILTRQTTTNYNYLYLETKRVHCPDKPSHLMLSNDACPTGDACDASLQKKPHHE